MKACASDWHSLNEARTQGFVLAELAFPCWPIPSAPVVFCLHRWLNLNASWVYCCVPGGRLELELCLNPWFNTMFVCFFGALCVVPVCGHVEARRQPCSSDTIHLDIFFFFVRRFVIGLELSDKARQTGPWASWICLSSHLSTGLSVPATAQLFLLRFWGSNQLLMFAELALSQASPSPPHSQDLNLLRNRGFVQRFHKSWVEQSFFSYLWILYKFSIFGTDKLLLLFLPFNKVHCNLRRIVQV